MCLSSAFMTRCSLMDQNIAARASADQNAFLRIVSGMADGFLYHVDPRQEEYDRQTDHEILPRSHVRRFPMGVRILMLDVLAGRYASVSCRPHI